MATMDTSWKKVDGWDSHRLGVSILERHTRLCITLKTLEVGCHPKEFPLITKLLYMYIPLKIENRIL